MEKRFSKRHFYTIGRFLTISPKNSKCFSGRNRTQAKQVKENVPSIPINVQNVIMSKGFKKYTMKTISIAKAQTNPLRAKLFLTEVHEPPTLVLEDSGESANW